MRMLKLHVPR
nr:unnamed protein product [Callosobruchus analis]